MPLGSACGCRVCVSVGCAKQGNSSDSLSLSSFFQRVKIRWFNPGGTADAYWSAVLLLLGTIARPLSLYSYNNHVIFCHFHDTNQGDRLNTLKCLNDVKVH